MARWTVQTGANGNHRQGSLSFVEAVREAVEAHQRGVRWDARVRGPRDTAYRILNDNEAAKLVAAIAKELT